MISQLERSTSKYLRGPSHAHEKDASYSFKKKRRRERCIIHAIKPTELSLHLFSLSTDLQPMLYSQTFRFQTSEMYQESESIKMRPNIILKGNVPNYKNLVQLRKQYLTHPLPHPSNYT
jgi:hypothetical protein